MKKEDPRTIQIFSGLGCFVGLVVDGILFVVLKYRDNNWIYNSHADILWVTIGTVLVLCVTAGTGVGWVIMQKKQVERSLMYAAQSFGITTGALIGIVTLNFGYGYVLFIIILSACAIMGGIIGRLLIKSESK
ncbi:MAG: hypothetical protein ABF608_00070 [Sporolactobacillus sp.]